jgi:ATP-dependent helicase/nuclease subunit A
MVGRRRGWLVNDADRFAEEANAPQRVAANPTASVWVGASAGTGKTKILTDRVLNLMLAGTPPERILCITYTRAAAAQMNERISEQLAKWAASDPAALAEMLLKQTGRIPDDDQIGLARRLFTLVLDTPGGMNIQTIHAFCQSLLGRFPLEAGVAPHFSVIDERDTRELLHEARDALLRRIAAAGEGADEALSQALADIVPHTQEAGFSVLMARLASDRQRLARMIADHGTAECAVAAIRRHLGLADDARSTAIRAATCADGAFDRIGLQRAVRILAKGKPSDQQRAAAIARWLETSAVDREQGLDAYAAAFLTEDRDSHLPVIRKSLMTTALAKASPEVADSLRLEAERLLDAKLQERAAMTAEASAALVRLGAALLTEYKEQKRRRSLLDYDDLIEHAARLLSSSAGAQWVLYKLDGGIDHILIDEAQDTQPAAWRVVQALTEEFFAGKGAQERSRTFFAVGDLKQSIFSFQGADPDAFIENRDRFGERVRAAGGTWRPVDLKVSFRSTRAVLAAVDAVFAQGEARNGVALDNLPIEHQAYRRRDGGSVEIWPTLSPRMAEEPEPWTPPITRIQDDAPQLRLARIIARRIRRMLDIEERLPSQNRPIRPGDIMVLVRRRTPFVEELVRTLKDLHVAVAGVDRMKLWEQMAVMDLLALGQFALLPGDNLTLATVLKGPLVGLSEEQLFDLAHGRTSNLWQALTARRKAEEAFAEAHRRLAEVLAIADQMPPFEFYTHVLGPLAGRKRLIGRLGQDAEDAIGEFLQLTLAYERTHQPTLQGFLHWFETGEVVVKRDLEQGDLDAVRIMTVHGAKGLQAPIVFLPDTMQLPSHRGPSLSWSQAADGPPLLLWSPRSDCLVPEIIAERDAARERELQENRRLLYVAMTRAGDRLIVCGWKGKKQEPADCWYHRIREGLERPGSGLLLGRSEDPWLAADDDYDAACDSPALTLTLAYPQEGAVAAAEPAPPAEPAPLPAWAQSLPPPEPPMAQPLAPSRSEDEPSAQQTDRGGRTGRVRGRLIHRLLQSLPEVPPASRRQVAEAWLRRHASMLGTEAAGAIAGSVAALFEQPALADVFGPGSYAEVPFTGQVNGRLISGQIDRLIVAADSVTVLDYKTDRSPPITAAAAPPAYLRQMAAYRSVLRALYPGQRVRCLLLWTEIPRLMPLDDGMLDRYVP